MGFINQVNGNKSIPAAFVHMAVGVARNATDRPVWLVLNVLESDAVDTDLTVYSC
jgi:hypothetical protein